MDHLIKDRLLLKEEQRRNSKKLQQFASKAFKEAIKATWGKTSNEELEGEDGETDTLTLMAKSDTDLDNDSSEVSAPSPNEETLLETNSLNVPSEPRQELENSGGTIPEAVVSSEEEIGEGTSSDPVPETQNDNPQELILSPWRT
ncbi:hypothetical protein HAX54_051776 [Datura stramonium]|uniref:Uncharacterized protein n=1 Tax=Datura stramonium TaxID=4076 RepID=A0ABS8WRS5_DATST|nr:hypothetical protein [Datura stramonium]